MQYIFRTQNSPEEGMMLDTGLPETLGRFMIGQTKSDGFFVFVILGRTDAEICVVALSKQEFKGRRR